MGLLRNWTDWMEEHDPFFRAAKKATYGMVKQDSDNMEGIGRKLGWDWLTQEAQTNQKNPGRAVGKAAAMAASIYGGGLLGAGAGGAGATAAEEAAKQAAATSAYSGLGNAAVQSGNAAANMASAVPQGFANTMEAGLLDTGYTPSTAYNALKYGGDSGQGLLGSLGKWAANAPSKMSGGDARMAMQGMQLMQPQEQQQRPMAPPPPPAPPPAPSTFTGYGDPMAGMSEEQKRKLLMMLQQQGGMR